MDTDRLSEILEKVQKGEIAVSDALDSLKNWPTELTQCAHLDHHRSLRTDVPEVVFGENKTAEQITEILSSMLKQSYVVMATRVNKEKAAHVTAQIAGLEYHADARMLMGNKDKFPVGKGLVVVAGLSAGSSDLPVAQAAALTASCLGNEVENAYDVGVAGIHRLLGKRDMLERAAVLIVVAGMEGALPSVVAGLVSRPVIAVPTSVGYGTGFGGVAALLGMLNSCATGVAVVNIDNGFGAGCMASAINRK